LGLIAGSVEPSKAERMGNQVQHFACWLRILAVIESLVQTGKQGQA
jgi:hypothetical protein